MSIYIKTTNNVIKDYFYLLENYSQYIYPNDLLILKPVLIDILKLNISFEYELNEDRFIRIIWHNFDKEFLLQLYINRKDRIVWKGYFEDKFIRKSKNINKLIDLLIDKKNNNII